MKIEIWSDVVCPWCYIGKRRLEHALTEFEHDDEVEITWRSYQLQPDAPRGTAVPTTEYMATRFGPQAAQMTDRVTQIAKGEGLDFDYGKALSTSTFDAHRLLHLAADQGVADAAKERLLRAYASTTRLGSRGAFGSSWNGSHVTSMVSPYGRRSSAASKRRLPM